MQVVRQTYHIYSASHANFACLQSISVPHLQKIGKIIPLGCSTIVGETILDSFVDHIVIHKTKTRDGVLEVTTHIIADVDALSTLMNELSRDGQIKLLDS